MKNPMDKGHSLNLGMYSKKLHFLAHHLPQHPFSYSHLSIWVLTCGWTLSCRVLPGCGCSPKGRCVVPQYFWKGALWLQDCSPARCSLLLVAAQPKREAVRKK